MAHLERVDERVCVVFDDGRVTPVPLVLAIGRNYAEHAREQGLAPPEHLVMFSKSVASIVLDDEPIVIPPICQDREQVDYEGELAFVLGRSVKDIAADNALGAILGLIPANDVSARWWQKTGGGGQYIRGKSFDTFCPLGSRITPISAVPDVQALRLTTRLNGEVVQDASTAQMTWPIASILAELSRGATLPIGTIVLTGTPSGVGMSRDPQRFLREGDVVEVEIEGVGRLSNPVELG